MLYATIVSPNGGVSTQVTWHVGFHPVCYTQGECIEVQADGDELEYILDQFEGIPKRKGKGVLVWSGAFAAFIFNNLFDRRA